LGEIQATFDDLDTDKQQAVVAFMWVGRGDDSEDEWEKALAEACRNWAIETASLIAHPQLADYLQEGLSLMGSSCEE